MSSYYTNGLIVQENNIVNEDIYNDVEFLEVHLDERLYAGDDLEFFYVSRVVNDVPCIDVTKRVFYDSNQCIDFISSYQWRKIFFTVTDAFVHIVPLIHDLPQIVYIYIYSQAPEEINISKENYTKVRAIVNELSPDADTQIKADIEKFKQDLFPVNVLNPRERKTKLYTEEKSDNANNSGISISIFNKDKNCKSVKNLHEDNAQFIWFQLLIDILVKIPYNSQTFDEMLDECEKHRMQINNTYKKHFEDMRQNYQPSKALEYYTGATFLFSLFNQAFRSENIDLIFIFRSYLSDIFNQLQQLYIEQFSNNSDRLDVFRGQCMNIKEFNIIKENEGNLISINQFLSTTTDFDVACAFSGWEAGEKERSEDTVCVVFQIEIEQTNHSLKKPFADLKNISKIKSEREILFFPGAVFRIESVENVPTHDNNWYVILTLINDDAENEASGLRNALEKEYCVNPSLGTLGIVLVRMGDYKKAERYFQMIVEHLPRTHSALPQAFSSLGIIYENSGEYYKALEYQQQALELYTRMYNVIPDPQDNVGATYTNIGSIYHHLEKNQLALEYFHKALQVQKEPSRIGFTYNQIAMIHQQNEDYPQALEYFRKALQIDEEVLMADKFDPVLATSYNNIGDTYLRLKDHDNALKYLQHALDIRLKGTTSTHTDLAAIYSNLGTLYLEINETKKALEMYEKALEIDTQVLPENHISLVTSYQNMANSYMECGELTEALVYCEKALDIMSKIDPENSTINYLTVRHNYACIQMELGNYSKASDILEDVLKSQSEAYQVNSRLFINAYTALSENHRRQQNIPKALECLEKCLDYARSSSLLIDRKRIPFIENMYEEIKAQGTKSDVKAPHSIIIQADKYDNVNDQNRLITQANKNLEQISSTDIYNRISELNMVGTINARRNNYDDALEAFEKAIILYNEQSSLIQTNEENFNELMALVYHNLARLYYRQANWLTAMQFSEKSLELALLQNEQFPLLPEIYNLLGVTCTRLEFYSKAEHCHKRSLRIAESISSVEPPDIQRYRAQLNQLEYLMKAYPSKVLD